MAEKVVSGNSGGSLGEGVAELPGCHPRWRDQRYRREGACLLPNQTKVSVVGIHLLIIRDAAAHRAGNLKSVSPSSPAPSLLVLTVLVIATGRNATQLILVMCSFCGGSLVFAQACLELVLFLLTDQFLPMTPLSDTPECCLLPSPAVVTSAPRRVWV